VLSLAVQPKVNVTPANSTSVLNDLTNFMSPSLSQKTLQLMSRPRNRRKLRLSDAITLRKHGAKSIFRKTEIVEVSFLGLS
jgi:hypothetical protein